MIPFLHSGVFTENLMRESVIMSFYILADFPERPEYSTRTCTVGSCGSRAGFRLPRCCDHRPLRKRAEPQRVRVPSLEPPERESSRHLGALDGFAERSEYGGPGGGVGVKVGRGPEAWGACGSVLVHVCAAPSATVGWVRRYRAPRTGEGATRAVAPVASVVNKSGSTVRAAPPVAGGPEWQRCSTTRSSGR